MCQPHKVLRCSTPIHAVPAARWQKWQESRAARGAHLAVTDASRCLVGSCIDGRDDRFKKYKIGDTPIQWVHTCMLWAEGPAWNGVGKFLMWSDIPNNIQLRWLNDDGRVSVYRNPAGYSNGNTFDWEGRQLS